MTSTQKKTYRYSFRQLITEVNNWQTTDIQITQHLELNKSNTLLNYKIFNDGRFIINGFTEFNHGTGALIFETSKLPFNVSRVISLDCSRYDTGSGNPFNFSIYYDKTNNKVKFPMVCNTADWWNSLVWNIEGFI